MGKLHEQVPPEIFGALSFAYRKIHVQVCNASNEEKEKGRN